MDALSQQISNLLALIHLWEEEEIRLDKIISSSRTPHEIRQRANERLRFIQDGLVEGAKVLSTLEEMQPSAW